MVFSQKTERFYSIQKRWECEHGKAEIGGGLNYYRRFPGDYLGDTVHLTMIQDGAYGRLLDTYYLHEKPLPLDRHLLYAMVRAKTPKERFSIEEMLTEFFKETPEGFTQKRVEEEIERTQIQANTNRTNGLKGGRPNTKITQSVSFRLAKQNPEKPILDSRLQTPEEETSKAKTIHTHKAESETFQPPTQAEICAFMQSRNVPDAERQAELFIAHHANRKWRLGGGRGPVMVSWRKAVVTWHGNIGKFNAGGNGNGRKLSNIEITLNGFRELEETRKAKKFN